MRGRLRRNMPQFIRFCVVGGSGVVVNLAIFTSVLLIWLAAAGHLHSVADLTHAVRNLVFKKETHGIAHGAAYLANLAGFVVSVLTNFYLNRRWTFRSSGRIGAELGKFATVSVFAYSGQLLVFWLLRNVAGVGPIPSQLVAILCVMPVNYIANKLWSFR
jgi:putative flippase GtrA